MEWNFCDYQSIIFAASPGWSQTYAPFTQQRHLSRSFAVVFHRNDGRLYLIREGGSLTRGNLVTSLKEKGEEEKIIILTLMTLADDIQGAKIDEWRVCSDISIPLFTLI